MGHFAVSTMGVLLSKVMDRLGGMKDARLLMLGLDAAGKTTVLYKLKHNETVTTIPTVGFNVEELDYKKLRMTVWDVGGQDRIRKLWRHYYQGVQGLVFVVDSSDQDRIQDAHDELHRILDDDSFPLEAAVLVFANKQDLPHAFIASEIVEKMKLQEMRGRQWFVQSTCATTGDGLHEGLDWLARALDQK